MAKIVSLLTALALNVTSCPFFWVPTLEIDASDIKGAVSSRASGHLYGIAEKGIPSKAMTNSLDISSVSQKVVGGLQHPVGDVAHTASQLDNCDYIVVYLQDSFDTWYYCHQQIVDMRKEGTYDWREFINKEYFPRIREAVEYLSKQEYADRLVYCIYNEADNGIWFGDFIDGNCVCTEESRQNFYEAWKMTYDLVKSLDPDAKIGGPGYFDYDTAKITNFMSCCKENACVPEIMIYHELSTWSIPDWQKHVDDYRRIEKELGISELPIIVTEYGCMDDCGEPSRMLQYVTAIEKSGVWGNIAFWRLANNLNDNAADDNSPNSSWWLYRWYADMEGNLLGTKANALREKDLHDGDWRLKYTGLASMTEEKDKIEVICNGSKDMRAVKLTNLNETQLSDKVNVKVECVYYKGLTGIVSEPYVIKEYTVSPACGTLNINIPGTDSASVYHITVTPAGDEVKGYSSGNLPVRYEFEEGRLKGKAYTYDSAYATTGEQKGMVGGFENDGDGVRLYFTVSKFGTYNLEFIYGNSNDGSKPSDRDFSKAYLKIDGKEQVISFPNTIKSEYTSCLPLQVELTPGVHAVEFSHNEGTFVLDSMLVSLCEEGKEISVLDDSADKSAFLAVAPYDGFFRIDTNGVQAKLDIDGATANVSSGDLVYLRRGLNEVKFDRADMTCTFTKTDEKAFTQTVTPAQMTTCDSAKISTDKYGNTYLDGISCEGGKAAFKVSVSESGDYRITLTYANNSEGGYHAYNVDLIERYVSVETNGTEQDVFCRNTYSNYNYRTVTFNLSLNKGENEITFSNSGNTKFNNTETFAPLISTVTVNQVCS